MTTSKTDNFLGKYYFLITPILFYSILHLNDLNLVKLSLSLLASTFLIKRKLLLFLLIVTLLLLKSDKDLALEGNQLSSINFQRGDHQYFSQPKFISKIFHNKVDYFYTFITHAQNYFSPVAVFSSGIYPKQTNDIPIPYLFPWDFIFLVACVRRIKIDKRYLVKLVLITSSFLFVPYGTETSFYLAIPVILLLKYYIVSEYIKMNNLSQYSVFVISFIYSSYLLWLTSIYLP